MDKLQMNVNGHEVELDETGIRELVQLLGRLKQRRYNNWAIGTPYAQRDEVGLGINRWLKFEQACDCLNSLPVGCVVPFDDSLGHTVSG